MLPGKKIDATFMLQALRRRALFVALPPLIAGFGALVYSSTLPDLYQSEMLIAVDPQRVPDAIVRSTVTLGTDRRLEALKIKVLSRTALLGLMDEFGLYQQERATLPLDVVVEKFRTNIGMVMQIPRPRWGEDPQPTAFRVQFTYTDPEKARLVAQRVGSYFVEQNVADRGALAVATNKFLEDQLAESRVALEDQERRLEEFRQRHGQELPTQMQSNMQSLTLAQTQVQSIVESAARDRDRKLMLERLYREASTERPTRVVAVGEAARPGAPTTAATATQALAAARANLASLELRYKSDHPDVVRTRRLIAELEPKAAAESTFAASAAASQGDAMTPPAADLDPAQRENLRQMRAEIESLDRQLAFKESEERRVRAEISELRRRLEAVPGLESEWASLSRDYDTKQAAYRELLQKSETTKLAANLEEQNIGERFRIVDPAMVPVRPMPSQRIRYNAMGFGVGLVLGLLIAAFLELRDRSFRTESDVLDVLSLPVLATVPYVQSAAEKISERRRRLAVSAAGVVCLVAAGYVTWTLKLWKSIL